MVQNIFHQKRVEQDVNAGNSEVNNEVMERNYDEYDVLNSSIGDNNGNNKVN